MLINDFISEDRRVEFHASQQYEFGKCSVCASILDTLRTLVFFVSINELPYILNDFIKSSAMLMNLSIFYKMQTANLFVFLNPMQVY